MRIKPEEVTIDPGKPFAGQQLDNEPLASRLTSLLENVSHPMTIV